MRYLIGLDGLDRLCGYSIAICKMVLADVPKPMGFFPPDLPTDINSKKGALDEKNLAGEAQGIASK